MNKINKYLALTLSRTPQQQLSPILEERSKTRVKRPKRGDCVECDTYCNFLKVKKFFFTFIFYHRFVLGTYGLSLDLNTTELFKVKLYKKK